MYNRTDEHSRQSDNYNTEHLENIWLGQSIFLYMYIYRHTQGNIYFYLHRRNVFQLLGHDLHTLTHS